MFAKSAKSRCKFFTNLKGGEFGQGASLQPFIDLRTLCIFQNTEWTDSIGMSMQQEYVKGQYGNLIGMCSSAEQDIGKCGNRISNLADISVVVISYLQAQRLWHTLLFFQMERFRCFYSPDEARIRV